MVKLTTEGFPVRLMKPFFNSTKQGAFVAVRKASKDDNKTYLGVYLGYLPIQLNFTSSKAEEELTIHVKACYGNPAIWIPELNEIVYGFESWWGDLKSADDLKQITDADIENVWYVRALKELSSGRSD